MAHKKMIMIRIFLIVITVLSISKSYSQNGEKEYLNLLNEIKSKHDTLLNIYSKANSKEKDSIIEISKVYLIKTISKNIFPYWYGTQWDFNGVTRIPKKGKIACGYFVTNVMTDLGFNIPRIKWAQSASEVFIKKLALTKNIKRFTKTKMSDFENHLKKSGNGIYLVGLDMHVGFIVVDNDNIRFVHSSYYKPEIGVISEKLDSWNPLRDSNYRIIGKLFSNLMIENWIIEKRYD
tara:strand:- start:10 stop:714 length:705 start_codon:yes stop_codon:yes gene_type:complete